VAVNWLAANFFARFDLTQDERYTLSPAAMNIVEDASEPIVIEVFLQGNFPRNLEGYAMKPGRCWKNFRLTTVI